jgi:hypothetical protein
MKGLDFHVRRIEAGSSRSPEIQAENVLETEIESFEGGLLTSFADLVKAGAENQAAASGLRAAVQTLSLVFPGDPALNERLYSILRDSMKKQHLKIRNKDGVDEAAFFSAEGIPALSLGIALGKEDPVRDTVFIKSVEKGRRLLERFVTALGEQL